MAICGSCKGDFPQSEILAHTKPCHAGFGRGGRKFVANMDRVRTVTCANPRCKNTQEGRVGDLLGWRCADHGGSSVAASAEPVVRFVTGTKVLFRGKRFEILEVLDNLNTLHLRTGGRGMMVPMDAVENI